ncbi:MAG: alanine acetyltransferase [Chitinophagaceae bacterium]|nr:alanine acetyltransferase [Chitinophagaceae bacterium]
MQFETLETKRLYLRKLTDEDYVRILTSGTDEELVTFLGVTPDNIEKERARAEKGFATFNKSLLIFQLIDKETEQLIGWCGYHTWYLDHHRAEIGYSLNHDDQRGKGLMSEAIAVILAYGFDTMKLKRVEAFIGPTNTASLKLVRKFGFTQEGRLREHYLTNGVYEDSILFSLLEREFRR